jgi:peptidyl-tRNA hydrolase
MAERDPDPYKLYTVMRRGLGLKGGKIGAQCQHAFDYLSRAVEAFERQARFEPVDRWTWEIHERDIAQLRRFREWQGSTDHAKVVLGATDEEYEQVKIENPTHFKVIDLGYTQVAPNTETCLALWPMRMSERSPILVKLRPL